MDVLYCTSEDDRDKRIDLDSRPKGGMDRNDVWDGGDVEDGGCRPKEAVSMIRKTLQEIPLTEWGVKVQIHYEVIPPHPNPQLYFEKIYNQLETIFKQQRRVVILLEKPTPFISGVQAFLDTYQETGIVFFCARPPVESSTELTNTNSTLFHLIEKGLIQPYQVILIGVRVFNEQEIKFIKQHNIRTYFMNHISSEGVNSICYGLMEATRAFKHVFILLDLDVADPVFIPENSSGKTGGLTIRELLLFIQKIMLLHTTVVAGITSIPKTPSITTSRLISRLIVELGINPPNNACELARGMAF